MISYSFAVVGQGRVTVLYNGSSVEAGWLFIHKNYEVDRLAPRGPSVEVLDG